MDEGVGPRPHDFDGVALMDFIDDGHSFYEW